MILRKSGNVDEVPKFYGGGVSKFLNRYEEVGEKYGCTEQILCDRLVLHLSNNVYTMMRNVREWREGDWKGTKEVMMEMFGDEEEDSYTVSDLDKFVRKMKKRGRVDSAQMLSKAFRGHTDISKRLVREGVITWREETRSFLGLIPHDIFADLETVQKLKTRVDWSETRRREVSRKETERAGVRILKIGDMRDALREVISLREYNRRTTLPSISSYDSDFIDSDFSEDRSLTATANPPTATPVWCTTLATVRTILISNVSTTPLLTSFKQRSKGISSPSQSRRRGLSNCFLRSCRLFNFSDEGFGAFAIRGREGLSRNLASSSAASKGDLQYFCRFGTCDTWCCIPRYFTVDLRET